jgi:hypothetical protein
MKNIFLVFTPLQLLVAIRVIKFIKIEKKKTLLIYYGYKKNKLTKNYLKKAKFFFSKIEYIKLKRFPLYLLQILRLKKKYNKKVLNFYTAASDNIINYYFLSYFKSSNIFTIDDGAGDYEINARNFFDNTIILKKFIYWLLGNRYFRKKLNDEKKKHFTINNYFFDLNKVYVGALFEKKNKKKIKTNYKKEINFYIGTVNEEYFFDMKVSDVEKEKYIEAILNFLKNKKNIVYLKHPRSTLNYKNNFFLNIKKQNLIAEEVILQYMNKNYKINIFGFYGSTVFYNLIKYKSISKYYFCFKKKHFMKKTYKNFFSKNFNKVLITI